MKKIALLLCLVLTVVMLAGCGGSKTAEEKPAEAAQTTETTQDETKSDVELAIQSNSRKLPGFAFFSDTLRDLMRGRIQEHTARGFVAGAETAREDLDAARMKLIDAVVGAAHAQLGRGDWISGVLDTVLELEERYPGDIGVLGALLLNHIHLSPGEGVYLDAGHLRGERQQVVVPDPQTLR